MTNAAAIRQSLHVLEIPTSGHPILVPSACVAEVVNIGSVVRAPQAPSWCLGIVGWRQQGVPIISFEELTGQPGGGIASRGKLIVFFPFPGQPKHQFFAFMSTSEPQPHSLNAADAVSVVSPVQSNYIAASINLKGTSVLIPNLETLGATVFPKMV